MTDASLALGMGENSADKAIQLLDSLLNGQQVSTREGLRGPGREEGAKAGVVHWSVVCVSWSFKQLVLLSLGVANVRPWHMKLCITDRKFLEPQVQQCVSLCCCHALPCHLLSPTTDCLPQCTFLEPSIFPATHLPLVLSIRCLLR